MMAVSQEDLAFLQDALPFWNGLDKHAQEKLAGAVTPLPRIPHKESPTLQRNA